MNNTPEPYLDSNGQAVGLGDVVLVREGRDHGGTVIGVFPPNAIVYRNAAGEIETWDNADDVVLLARANASALPGGPGEQLLADQFRTARSVDTEGTPLHIGDRVECLNDEEQGGVIIAMADNTLLMMLDWTVGSTLSHGVLYKNADEVRVLPDVHGRVIEFVNARLPKSAKEGA